MAEKRIKNLEKAISQASSALALYKKEAEQRALNFLMVTKASEILVETAWRYFKYKVEDEGLSALSPKESVRKAAMLGLIDNPDKWIEFVEARNLSVHDYFTLDEEGFVKLTHDLVRCAKKIGKEN